MEKKIDWKSILEDMEKYHDYEYPKVSVIVPTYNVAEKISLTLRSILDQNYPNFEVIIVDAGSRDRTLEAIISYHDERVKIFTVSSYQRYEMLNKGITHCTGQYTNILFPGDFFIYPDALKHIMTLALDNDKPELVYCGTLIRDGRTDPKILFRPLTLALLQRGQQPTSLQSCWFKTETLRRLGKFNTGYYMRGGYDLMCRFLLAKDLRVVSTERVLTDYDLRFVNRQMVQTHFTETFKIIFHYFGFVTTLYWLLIQTDFARLLKIWYRSLKMAFFGR